MNAAEHPPLLDTTGDRWMWGRDGYGDVGYVPRLGSGMAAHTEREVAARFGLVDTAGARR